MNSYNLPNDLSPDQELVTNEVIIRSYHTEHNTVKNKIILHQNMINLLIKGKKVIQYPEVAAVINEGELLILSCGNCLTSEVTTDTNVFSSILIYFSNQVLTDFFIKYNAMGNDSREKIKQPFLTYKQNAFIVHYISSLQIMLRAPDGFSAELKQLKLEELLLYLLHQDAAKLYSLSILAKGDEDLKLRKTMESNIGNQVTIEELAFLCNCSLSTFKRKFDRVYGTTPQKWLFEQKMRLAANLLKHPNERPGIVYQKIGYENHSSFSSSFKQHYGLTPKEYHDQHMNFRA